MDMPSIIEPREAEAMAVTLARMEGKLDNVMEKVDGHAAEIVRHREQITQLQAAQQQLESNMKSAEKERVSTAAAVKAAEETRVAEAKALVDSSTQRWTPFQRTFAVVAAVAAFASLFFYYFTMTR